MDVDGDLFVGGVEFYFCCAEGCVLSNIASLLLGCFAFVVF